MGQQLGTVIITGLLVGIPTTVMCWLFASKFLSMLHRQETLDEVKEEELMQLPALWKSILPVIIPVLLIATGAVTSLVAMQQGLNIALQFFGSPVVALSIGLLLSLLLVKGNEIKVFKQWMVEAIHHAGPILIIVGAGGVFGNVLKKTPLAEMVEHWVSSGSFSSFGFLLAAYAMGALLKTAQGSTTSAIIIVTSILAPIAVVAGFKSPL